MTQDRETRRTGALARIEGGPDPQRELTLAAGRARIPGADRVQGFRAKRRLARTANEHMLELERKRLEVCKDVAAHQLELGAAHAKMQVSEAYFTASGDLGRRVNDAAGTLAQRIVSDTGERAIAIAEEAGRLANEAERRLASVGGPVGDLARKLIQKTAEDAILDEDERGTALRRQIAEQAQSTFARRTRALRDD